MVIVDIGAHIGYYTLIAANLIGKDGKVFAFEPAPDNFALLKKNVELNSYENVVLAQKAVSNKDEITKLFLRPDNTGDHRIYDSGDDRDFVTVETVTLDEFFKNKESVINIIKMDCQGAEMAILQGMSKILKQNNKLKIITEFWPAGLKGFGFSGKEFLEEFMRYGFRFYNINEQEEKIELIDIDRLMQMCDILTGEKNTNLLCLKGTINEGI